MGGHSTYASGMGSGMMGNKGTGLMQRGREGPEEEDDINRRCNCAPGIHREGEHESWFRSQGQGRCDCAAGTHAEGQHQNWLQMQGGGAQRGTVQHVVDREEQVIEKQPIINEVVHHKNVHVVQPVINREVEVEHVKHHTLAPTQQHGGAAIVDEGSCTCPSGTHNLGEHSRWAAQHGQSRAARRSSSSSSSSDDETGERRHRRTAGATTGVMGGQHHGTSTGTTGTSTGMTGTSTGMSGTSAPGAEHHEKKSLGQKIKDVFKGGHN